MELKKLWDAKQMKTVRFWRAVIGETLALFLFAFVVCASTLPWYSTEMNSSKILIISFTVGFAIATLVHCFGEVSGGHINPAVTLSMLCTLNIGIFRAFFYMIGQCVGAIGGAALLLAITPEEYRGNLGVTLVNDSITAAQGFGMEFMLTFILVFTIFSTVDPKRHVTGSQPIAIGLAIIIDHLIGVYWAGPFAGALAAAWLYVFTFGRTLEDKNEDDSKRSSGYEMSTTNSYVNRGATDDTEIGTQTPDVLNDDSSLTLIRTKETREQIERARNPPPILARKPTGGAIAKNSSVTKYQNKNYKIYKKFLACSQANLDDLDKIYKKFLACSQENLDDLDKIYKKFLACSQENLDDLDKIYKKFLACSQENLDDLDKIYKKFLACSQENLDDLDKIYKEFLKQTLSFRIIVQLLPPPLNCYIVFGNVPKA
uniref:Aquaporin-4-like n=1 Tax=Saccoglossus kowalevskii TaxID=10224 RepID=A0ABM0GSL0_SACKO|nr:PREDICTED: aquaporin-4-like [Saccoglossus kowalevskii]